MLTRCAVVLAMGAANLAAAAPDLPGDRMLACYFERQVASMHAQAFAGIESRNDWLRQRETLREQLREMLGLSPLPERTPLHATITGTEEQPEFSVEKLHYQSAPGLYITANLYLPKPRPTKAPAILYLSGHSRAREGNVSFGSKANYQHHGAWFARNGYVCLTIDSIGSLAEIEGQHHGTHTAGRWWWNARGYTPAGVEAWNAMRALDYLQSRPEVDPQRIGATGRSGGGIGTWWIAALDDRIKVAVPVAGMTDLQNQVVDGKVSRHCDCMFLVNTHRWDYAKIAALVAPRPLLISNTDKDDIFPLDGVVRLHRDVARIYALYGAKQNLGLLITDGPHRDSQDLQVPAFRWFNRFLKKDEAPIDRAEAKKFFPPAQLRVFSEIPADQRNTTIDATFVSAAKPEIPRSAGEWPAQRARWLTALREKCFAGWPASPGPAALRLIAREGSAPTALTRYEFTSEECIDLPIVVHHRPGGPAPKELFVFIAGDEPAGTLRDELHARMERGEIELAIVSPRGIGPTAWSGDAQAQTHLRRRFMLLGQTVDGMRVWDIARAVIALRESSDYSGRRIHLRAEHRQAVNALYASLFVDGLASVELVAPPASHARGPDYLNVLRHLDVPQAAVLAADRQPVRLRDVLATDWAWSIEATRALGWKSLEVVR